MYFLGMSGGVLSGNQDASAALLKDGEVVAAVEEERLIKVKHANGRLPRRAIDFCLQKAGISIRDVHSIGFPGATYRGFEGVLESYFRLHFGHVPPIRLFDHHTAHAVSTFAYSPFEEALVLTADFSGDGVCTALFEGSGDRVEKAWSLSRPDSLGLFYSMMTQYLGFGKDDEEHKVMGLAAYGEPRFDLSDVLQPSNGTYRVNPEYVRSALHSNVPAPSKQEPIFQELPLPERPRLPGEEITDYHRDVAASAQRAVEEAVLHILRHEVARRSSRNLCLAGGVALNCVLNRRLNESGLFERIFVPPHTSDAGLALGCAALLSIEYQGRRPSPLRGCAWGPSYTDEEIVELVQACGAPFERVTDVASAAARDLAAGKIVGWFQGGMEFGPRALGNRSILADPRRADMRDRVNRLVKFREAFRPFAPSCLEERAEEFFEHVVPTPHMTMTFEVKPEKRDVIPAVTHVDGTARVQTVSREVAPLYHRLISSFAEETGVPVLLNTSLNVIGQPIIAEPRDALGMFYSCGIDRLAIGGVYLRKPG